jgi:hypothetical protein
MANKTPRLIFLASVKTLFRHLTVAPLVALLWVLLAAPGALGALQQQGSDTIPLFASLEPLEFTLLADYGQLKKDRSQESEEREGRIILTDSGGEAVEVDLLVKTRGNFRLRKENCSFPPLRINLPEEGLEGTALEGQDKLKLVTHCMDNDRYEQNVVEEYLTYRIYGLFTDLGFQVRLARVTYTDLNGRDSVERIAFILEDEEAMAARLNGRVLATEQITADPSEFQQQAAGRMYLFQYLIGNEDWSMTHFHNIQLVRLGLDYFAVPYDFDFSGFVDAPYAEPNPEIGIDNVRDRLFFGPCSDRIDYGALFAEFNGQREAILDLIGSETLLIERNIRSAQRYVEDFYEILNNPRQAERLILRACRK